jgi:hypothetical protein
MIILPFSDISTEVGLNGQTLNYGDKLNIQKDVSKIEKARLLFRNQDFPQCLEILQNIEFKHLLSKLDHKIIEFCEHQISKVKDDE